ncbi:MAG: CAP domain-containing protein [Actinomycetota bacterium]
MRVPRTLGAYGMTMVLGLFSASSLLPRCAPAPAPAPTQAVVLNSVPTADCLTRTNAERTKRGMVALKVDTRVAAAARLHSAYQARTFTMTHTGANGSNAQQRMTAAGFQSGWWGENVAAGQHDCAIVVTAWMGSLHHRENILNPHFTVIGIGAVRSANGALYWTMDLASPA